MIDQSHSQKAASTTPDPFAAEARPPGIAQLTRRDDSEITGAGERYECTVSLTVCEGLRRSVQPRLGMLQRRRLRAGRVIAVRGHIALSFLGPSVTRLLERHGAAPRHRVRR